MFPSKLRKNSVGYRFLGGAALHNLRKNSDSRRVWEGHEFYLERARVLFGKGTSFKVAEKLLNAGGTVEERRFRAA